MTNNKKVKITNFETGEATIYTVSHERSSPDRGHEWFLMNDKGQICRTCQAIPDCYGTVLKAYEKIEKI